MADCCSGWQPCRTFKDGRRLHCIALHEVVCKIDGEKQRPTCLLGRGRTGSSVPFPLLEPVAADTAELAAAWKERTADAAADAFAAANEAFRENGAAASGAFATASVIRDRAAGAGAGALAGSS